MAFKKNVLISNASIEMYRGVQDELLGTFGFTSPVNNSLIFNNAVGGDISFQTSSTEKFRVTGSGRIFFPFVATNNAITQAVGYYAVTKELVLTNAIGGVSNTNFFENIGGTSLRPKTSFNFTDVTFSQDFKLRSNTDTTSIVMFKTIKDGVEGERLLIQPTGNKRLVFRITPSGTDTRAVFQVTNTTNETNFGAVNIGSVSNHAFLRIANAGTPTTRINVLNASLDANNTTTGESFRVVTNGLENDVAIKTLMIVNENGTFSFPNLPIYANDAAANTGGVKRNEYYKAASVNDYGVREGTLLNCLTCNL